MISKSITWEEITFVLSLFWGMVLAFEYDCIRVFRRIVKHKKVWTMSAEDIIFWINAGITVFCVTYELNNGIIRGFSIAAFVLGAVIYKYSFGLVFVKYATRFIKFLLKPLKKFISFIRMKINVEKLRNRMRKLKKASKKTYKHNLKDKIFIRKTDDLKGRKLQKKK